MDLRHYLFENRITIKDFAEKIGVSAVYVGEMKRGKRPLLSIAKRMIEVSKGEMSPQDIYPELFEIYEKSKREHVQ